MRALTASVALALLPAAVGAHEMTPTYPELFQSYMPGIMQADLSLFNAREDVEYYAISIWDAEWNPVPFASAQRVMHIPPGGRQDFEIYIRQADAEVAVYICTTSMLRAGQQDNAIIESRICSRLDGEQA
jgi:hypothetical protein